MNIVDNDIYMFKNAKEELLNAVNAPHNTEWKFSCFIHDDISIYTKSSKSGCVCVCGIGIINATPNEIMTEIKNREQLIKLDLLLENVEILDIINNQRIIHLTFHGISHIISKRDLVFLETHVKEHNKTQMLISSNTQTNFFPNDNNYVRMELINGGWHIKPIDNNNCIVTYYTHLDCKTQLVPQNILKLITTKFPAIIYKIRKIINDKKN